MDYHRSEIDVNAKYKRPKYDNYDKWQCQNPSLGHAKVTGNIITFIVLI